MHALGFDILEIVDERGEVLAAGHYTGHVGDSDPDALAVARRVAGQRAPGARPGVRRRPRPRRARARVGASRCSGSSAIARPASSSSAAGSSATASSRGSHPSARLYAADGTLLAARAAAPPQRWPRRTVELAGPDGEAAARVEIAVSQRRPGRRRSTGIAWASGALAVGGFVLALLGGAVVARRITGRCASWPTAPSPSPAAASTPRSRCARATRLASSPRTFNSMTRDLPAPREELVRAERVAAWREIAQRIAHEIKNPLTPIQMAIETLQQEHRRSSARSSTSSSASRRRPCSTRPAGSSASSPSSRPSRACRSPSSRRVDVNEVVDGALALYKGGETRSTSRSAAICRERSPTRSSSPRSSSTSSRTRATRSARAGGRIRVATPRRRRRASSSRSPTTAPASATRLADKLFTPYFTTKHASGTGLGLAIVHRIVSDHGGDIRVGGAPGAGAVFTVALPRAPTAATS